MRRAVVAAAVIGLGVVGLAACQKREETKTAEAPAAAQMSAAPPARKAGLWKQTVSTAGMRQEMEFCLDSSVDERLSLFGQAAGEDRCTTNQTTPTAGGWRFESVCNLGPGGTVTTTGTATGDLSSRYEVRAVSRTTGAAAPQMNAEHEMTLEAAWQGPCPAGMKPGDMRLPGGVTINLLEMGG